MERGEPVRENFTFFLEKLHRKIEREGENLVREQFTFFEEVISERELMPETKRCFL